MSVRKRSPLYFLPIGDSKTASSTCWPAYMANRTAYLQECPARIATGGISTYGMACVIDARLALAYGVPDVVLINLGANDAGSPTEGTWRFNTLYIMDAVHAAYPGARVYLAHTWLRGQAVAMNLFATYRLSCIAARSPWAFVGPDERVFLEGGDDGATYTTDGIHPNADGYALSAAQWRTILGY